MASLVPMLSSPVDNEVAVTKLLSATLSSPNGVDRDFDKNFLSGDSNMVGDNRLAAGNEENIFQRCHFKFIPIHAIQGWVIFYFVCKYCW